MARPFALLSPAERRAAGCAERVSCTISVLLGLIWWVIWFWLLPMPKPICSIQDIYVPVLNKSQNSNYTKIYFDLKIDNLDLVKGIYYDAVDLTFYYPPNLTTPIGNFSFPGFYQGYGKTAHRKDWVEVSGVPWEAAKKVVNNGSAAVFRVDLATAVRFKILAWKTKRHKLVRGADVEVNDLGKKAKRKRVRLKEVRVKSGAPERHYDGARVELLVAIFGMLSLVLITPLFN